MRKLQQLAVITMAVGSLSAVGAGVSLADTQGAPPQGQMQAPQGQMGQAPQAPQGQTQTAQGQVQAPQAQAPGPQAQAPQAQAPMAQAPQAQAPQSQAPQGTQISPQVAPTVTLPQSTPLDSVLSAPQEQYNTFRPYQECSPQTVVQANVPLAILGQSTTKGDTCTQINNAFEN